MLRKIITFIGGLLGLALGVAGPLFLIKISQFKAMGAAGAAMVMPPTTTPSSSQTIQVRLTCSSLAQPPSAV